MKVPAMQTYVLLLYFLGPCLPAVAVRPFSETEGRGSPSRDVRGRQELPWDPGLLRSHSKYGEWSKGQVAVVQWKKWKKRKRREERDVTDRVDIKDDEEEGPPVLVTSPLTLSVQTGEEAFLPCFVSRLGQCQPTWQTGGRVLAVGRMMVRKSSRLRVTSYHGLVVSGVLAADEGEYSCQVDYKGKVQEVTHTLEVLQPPSLQKRPLGDAPVQAREGISVTLRCSASGVPNPIISWSGPSNQSLGQGLSLTLAPSRGAGGEYSCTASNGVGEDRTASFQLQVNYPPTVSVHVSRSLSPYGILTASLSCLVTASPRATVGWWREGRQVLQYSGGEGEVSKSVLEVEPLLEEALGLYQCRAENFLGHVGDSLELFGTPLPPVITSHSSSPSTTSYSASWTAHSISPIIQYELAYKNKWLKFSGSSQQTEWRVVILLDLITAPFNTSSSTSTNFSKTSSSSNSSVPSTSPISSKSQTSSTSPNSTFSKSTIPNTTHQTYLLKDLVQNSAYEMKVRARNCYGWSELSAEHTFFTETEAPEWKQGQQSSSSSSSSCPLRFYLFSEICDNFQILVCLGFLMNTVMSER